jgi:hypothetical protein
MRTKDRNTLALEELLLKMIVGGLLAFIFVQFIVTAAHAQTVEQVAAEVDQTQVDVQTVNAKSESNKTKVVGVEARVTALEARPTIDPTIEARVVALETAPPPPQYDDTLLASRVSALEAAGTPTVTQFVARDFYGAEIARWYDRSAVGLAFVWVNGGTEEVRVRIQPDGVSWIGVRASSSEGITRLYQNATCGADGSAPVIQVSKYHVPDLSSDDFFGGYIFGDIVVDASGMANVFRFDTSQVVTIGQTYIASGGSCGQSVRNADVYVSTYAFTLPMWTAPIVVAQEQ